MKKILLTIALLPAFFLTKAQCPDFTSARKTMASSFHSSVLITHDSIVRYWGDGASHTSAGANVINPVTLASTGTTTLAGIPLSVAAGSVGYDQQHQLFLHTTAGVYGWGYSNRTINSTNGNVALTAITLPVPISQVNFIEASGGGLAIVTNTGAVWVKNGGAVSGSTPLIYGDGTGSMDNNWHKVRTSAAIGDSLLGVTRISFACRALMALTASGKVYVWGDNVLLGNGTVAASRNYASLVTLPAGVVADDINIVTKFIYNTFVATATQFILGTDGKLYGVGENKYGPLGQGNELDATSWLPARVKGSGAALDTLKGIVQINTNNPYVLNLNTTDVTNNGGYAVGALTSSGRLYLWGHNNYDMIGGDTLTSPSQDSVKYTVPRVPPNMSYNNAAIGFFEMGGHTTAAFLAGSSKFCYIGHKVRGSMGDNTSADLTRKSFDCINTPEEFACPPAPTVGCPLPTASDIVASANHATLVINGEPSVSFWGEAASSAEPGINMPQAKTLYEYNGVPKGVAAGGLSESVPAQGTQMWLHTSQGIWGWGYSANTVNANRVGASPMTEQTLPPGVNAADISFIRASKGGLALVTYSGNVWVKAGAGSLCSPRIYGDGSTSLDAAGAASTVWHRVTIAGGTPLTDVIEMSFGGTAALAITKSGNAYVWGDKVFLGNGTPVRDTARATLMNLPADLTSGAAVPRTAEIIQSGALQSVQFILGSNNRIYSLGRNANGALGINNTTLTDTTTTWKLITSINGIRKMSSNNSCANNYYSIGAITLTGNVYLWGSNSNGMLGKPTATTNIFVPEVATTVPANNATNLELGGHQTIIFAKSTTAFYFAGHNTGGARAGGFADAVSVQPFTLSGTVSNCANVSFNLSGKLFNDNTGLTDSLVNGTAIQSIRGNAMFANLLDEAGYVIASTAITSTGTFEFNGFPFANYVVQISPEEGIVFEPAPVKALPSNWVFSGEQIGPVTGIGLDSGAPDGKIPVALSANRTNINFGVQQLPAPVDTYLNSRPNPGGTKTTAVTTAFTGIDTLGTIVKIHITAFPTFVTSITIGDTTYYSGTWPSATGVTFLAGTTVAIDPVDGAVTSVIPFKVIDNAAAESPLSANVTVPFIILPPVASNITAPALNSNDTARAIPQLIASNPTGTAISSYTVMTLPPVAEGVLYYCASAPSACALGSLTPVLTTVPLTPEQSASLYFNPAQSFTGEVTFSYKAKDANNLESNTANYIIPVFNNPPVTQNIITAQILDTHPQTQLPDLIGADADGYVVSYQVSGIPAVTRGTLSYCDNGTDTCTGTRLTIPVSGITTLTPEQMSTMKFHPVPGALGNYIFNYTAIDNNGLVSNISTYTIPVVGLAGGNLPPVATNITAQNINNNLGATPIPNLLGTDPDGTVNHFTLTGSLPPAAQGILYYCASAPAACAPGSLTAATAGMNLSPEQAHSLHFDPAPGFIGTASFTYTVTDNDGIPLTSAEATYKIPVVNNPPVANPTSVLPVWNMTTTPTLLPPLSGNDADGTIDSFNITSVPAVTQGTLKYCTVPGPACALTDITGPLSGLTPAQAATLHFVPNSTYTGDYVFLFTTVDNNHLVSLPATFTIPVVGLRPVNVGQPPVAYSFNHTPINSTSTASLPAALTGDDPDGTVVNYTITSIPAANHGLLTYCVAPANCSSEVSVGTTLTPAQAASLLFRPNPDFMGVVTFNYTNKDNDSNLSNTATVTIPVVNNPPVADNINNPGINRSAPAVTLNPLASADKDGNVVSYTILTVPTPDQGVLRLCSTPPVTGCMVVVPGQVIAPSEINKLSFTPDTLVHSPVVSFLYGTKDNSGNRSNIAVVNIPIINAYELPIDLISFTATKQNHNAMISWETGIEKEPITYELLYSTDGRSWSVLHKQNSMGAGRITNQYSYLHTPSVHGLQYYRLKMINESQVFTMSPVRVLNFDLAQSYSIMVQPNPVTDKVYLSTSDASTMSFVELYSNEGRKLKEFSDVPSGTALDMSSFNSGLYHIKIWDKNGEAQTIKVSKK